MVTLTPSSFIAFTQRMTGVPVQVPARGPVDE
jgi:hypothetical protein